MINTGKFTTLNQTAQIAGVMPSDNNIEFIGVRKTKEVLWLQNGTNHYFSDLPLQYFQLLKSAYLKDHKAIRFLSSITECLKRQIELYTYYMYGDVDTTPDISEGRLSPSENFRDTKNCPSLLWNSKNINIATHVLTPRQLVIVDLIGKDLPDKAIAATLGISHKTLDFHKCNLYKAVGVNTKTALLKMSIQYKVISFSC
ncbi:LuxR C-terminal-related transcriptional regulator [Lacinutrix sp. Hel_I_90]|uniref:helix-turn-helix transcriptional regulator n=1 Tax=Lacinutrix sp. Hel_I_90 TaxID=1249999 RepID=UPI0005CB11FD|nr:LuxR C-terminal-related transcriptional regulator [Lacinutrix sp. Hel_I_90]